MIQICKEADDVLAFHPCFVIASPFGNVGVMGTQFAGRGAVRWIFP